MANNLQPEENKFHKGNGDDGKHYWLTPSELYKRLDDEFHFDFDPCPFPKLDNFDGLTCEWGCSNYVNPPFGAIIHEGKKKGMTAWVKKAIIEWQKGKLVVMVYPIDKWVLMLLKSILGEHGEIRNLGDIKWLATEDGSAGKGTGRHIAMFVLKPKFICDKKVCDHRNGYLIGTSGTFGHAIFTVEKKGFTRSVDCYGTIKAAEKKFILFEDNDNFLYLVERMKFQFTKEEFKVKEK